jgi:hypothetical protein
MTIDIIREVFAGVLLLIGSFTVILKWLVSKILKEFKPNGGSSLKDQVNRLESRIDDIFDILAKGKDR